MELTLKRSNGGKAVITTINTTVGKRYLIVTDGGKSNTYKTLAGAKNFAKKYGYK